MIRIFSKLSRFLLIGAIGFLLSACTPKNIAYFQDASNSSFDLVQMKQDFKIQPHDKLSIIVKSKDPQLSNLFNLPVYTNRIGTYNQEFDNPTRNFSGNSEGTSSYTVDKQGNIDFPLLGSLHIEGMTRSELCGFIKGELMGRNLVKDPTVTVEFLNYGVSIMGEVRAPGRYDINKDNLTVLEALALAGDLDIQGRRDNIVVLREENGKLNTFRLDVTNAQQLANSPAYYLKQNDIVYVEPSNVRKRQTTVNGNTALQASFWVSVASLLTSVAVLIFK